MCPTLQHEPYEQAHAVGGFPQKRYDPHSNTYNAGWRDHPNLSYGAKPFDFQQHHQSRPPVPQYSSSNPKSQVFGRLPSQTTANPKQNASAITLRSGKELDEPKDTTKEEKEKETPSPQKNSSGKQPQAIVTAPPFPSRFAKSKKEEQDNDILETFRKVEVNIPLLDAIKQVPRYAKFLKELCTTKRRLKGDEKVHIGESVSAILQKRLPPKCKDPEMGVILQLIDRSTTYPKGVLEDILVQVNNLVFPADFYVIDTEEDSSSNSTPILLGRPFLKTSKTKIDVYNGTLTMEFDGKIVKFNIYDDMKYPIDDNPAYSVDVIDFSAQEVFKLDGNDVLEITISKHPEKEELTWSSKLQETIATLNGSPELQQLGNAPYIMLPTFDRKPLPFVLQVPIPILNPPMIDERGKHRKLQLQDLEDPVYD
ncbi:PREDICTED: uncharacterized protein LOC104588022 [Nelumbo nucifera]|uniref:Uncharacterized protein LOC104588022 n=1 Tax=Nelumbo nucifera TaxID=4432 RepID=A0A1U7YXB3_NELNU|nr:PREDICTED: uncharacterized protein LOC104588022 [Nelumbo nucifera]